MPHASAPSRAPALPPNPGVPKPEDRLSAALLLCLSRHLGQIQPGAHHADLHVCGCDPLLAPANSLYPKTEKGKNIPGWFYAPCYVRV